MGQKISIMISQLVQQNPPPFLELSRVDPLEIELLLLLAVITVQLSVVLQKTRDRLPKKIIQPQLPQTETQQQSRLLESPREFASPQQDNNEATTLSPIQSSQAWTSSCSHSCFHPLEARSTKQLVCIFPDYLSLHAFVFNQASKLFCFYYFPEDLVLETLAYEYTHVFCSASILGVRQTVRVSKSR